MPKCSVLRAIICHKGALWSDFSDSRKLDVHVQSINFAQGSVCNDVYLG